MKATTWPARLGIGDPHLCLIAAVVSLALRDAIKGSSEAAADALRYIYSHNFEVDCDWLGLDPTHVRRRVNALSGKEKPTI